LDSDNLSLDLDSMLESDPLDSFTTSTLTSSEVSEKSLPVETNWCAWFDEISFRIESFQVRFNSVEMRMALFDFPIKTVMRLVSDQAGRPVSKDELVNMSKAMVTDEWTDKAIERLTRGTRPWLQSSNPNTAKFQNMLYDALETLSNKTDVKRLWGLLGKYIELIEMFRNSLTDALIRDKEERLGLIQEVKDNAGPIRACFEEHLRAVGDRRLQYATKNLQMNTAISRADLIRAKIEERIRVASKITADIDIQREVQVACFEAVKRIVFSESRGIVTQLQKELTMIAHNHHLRTVVPVLPVFLRVVDDLRRQFKVKKDKYHPVLVRQIEQCDRFIGETRMVLAQLDTYTS